MDWIKVADVFGKFLQRVISMWPYVVIAIAIFGMGILLVDIYRNSKYYKTPWERREAREAKKRARAEERARKAFWGE